MTTTANIEHPGAPGNNCALSLAIHSRGFFSSTIHSPGTPLHQTAHSAQLANELRRFYAKQTQFAQHPNRRKSRYTKELSRFEALCTSGKQTQFEIRPRTDYPTTKMQNKPNLLDPEDVSSKLPRIPQKSPKTHTFRSFFLNFSHISSFFRAFSRIFTGNRRICANFLFFAPRVTTQKRIYQKRSKRKKTLQTTSFVATIIYMMSKHEFSACTQSPPHAAPNCFLRRLAL